MQSVYVRLSTPEIVQQFVDTLSPLNGAFDLISGRYILDARSLMGIFSLDLTKPIELKIYDDTPETMRAIEPFLA